MADKSCQPNAEQEKSCHTTEHFPQHGVVDELCVDHTGADESRHKKNDRFHHAPKNNRGDDCPVSHGQAVHQLLAFLANHFGRLPANGISFLFKHTSGVLADSHPACLMKGRDSLVRCRQASASLFSSFSTFSLRMPTTLQLFSNTTAVRSSCCIFSAAGIATSISKKSNLSLFIVFYHLSPVLGLRPVILVLTPPGKVAGTASAFGRDCRNIEHPDKESHCHVRKVTAVGCLPVVKFIVEHVQPRFRATRSAARCARMWMSWSLLIQPFLSIRQYTP